MKNKHMSLLHKSHFTKHTLNPRSKLLVPECMEGVGFWCRIGKDNGR